MARKYGKVFRCKTGKHKGKLVKYSYKNMKGEGKRMVLHKGSSKKKTYRRRY